MAEEVVHTVAGERREGLLLSPFDEPVRSSRRVADQVEGLGLESAADLSVEVRQFEALVQDQRGQFEVVEEMIPKKGQQQVGSAVRAADGFQRANEQISELIASVPRIHRGPEYSPQPLAIGGTPSQPGKRQGKSPDALSLELAHIVVVEPGLDNRLQRFGGQPLGFPEHPL